MCQFYVLVLFSDLKVMASKTKVYFVLEFAAGGELLKKIVSSGARSRSWMIVLGFLMH